MLQNELPPDVRAVVGALFIQGRKVLARGYPPRYPEALALFKTMKDTLLNWQKQNDTRIHKGAAYFQQAMVEYLLGDDGKVRFYCETDETEYCPHMTLGILIFTYVG